MSMLKSNFKRSPCEVVREINDLFQGDSELDFIIRKKCAEIEKMAKEMSIEICKIKPNYHEIWQDFKIDKEAQLKRLLPNYKYHKL